jgi:hypothetical protein
LIFKNAQAWDGHYFNIITLSLPSSISKSRLAGPSLGILSNLASGQRSTFAVESTCLSCPFSYVKVTKPA